uniref:Calmodulin n=1 Tax=Heterosigma akashiwo TaxID=2829 RepID=A0A7S3XMQ6_HETAK
MEFLLFIGQPSEKSCQRLKNTQKDVFNQWAVLETKSAYMAFEKYDEDLTGYIPTRMLRKVCRKLGLDLSEDNIEIISTEFESKRGFNYECFIAWCETSNLDRAERKVGHCLALLERAGMSFADVFGLKERGSEINPHQFQQVMLSLGFPLSHSEIDALIAKYDVDENGRIDVGELKRLLAKASAILDQNQSAAHNLGSVWKSATSQLSKAKKKEIAGNSDGTGFDIEEVQRALKKKIVQKARSQKDGSLKAVFNDISKGSLKPFGPRDLQLVMEEFGLDTNRKVKQALLNSMDLSGSGQVALYEFVHFISPVVGDDELRAVVNKLRQRLLKNQGSDDEQHSDDLNSLNASFVKFDKKSNGVVKTLQCENVLEESNAQLKAKEISLIIKFLDPENCGKVYYPEFVLLLRKDPIEFVQRQICQRIQALKRDGLSDKELFSALDTQDRGYITSADLVSGFQRWGLILNPDDCDSFIEKNGGDGEGRMVFKAFKQVEDGLAKGPTKRYIDPDLVSTDIELAILQALEWAFNWFDADGNGRIDADELGTILRAMGKDPSKKQVKGILKAADIDKNNYLSFEEFQSAALPYLLEEMQGSKMTESELKTFFDASDFNGDGQISHEEFTGFFVDTLRILTSDEAATLLRWVDRNKDGNVSWNEFLDLFSLIERLKKDQELEQSMDPVFASALRKLDHGAMPDPKEHILAFMGMPSGFRPSVLAPVGRTTKHTLAKALEVTADSTHGFTVKDMDVKLVSYASQVPTGQASAPVSRQQQAILLPTGAPSEDHTIKQVIISLKGARGIPTPHDRRLSDITYRCLRAVLFYDPPKQAGQIRQRSDFFIGNTYSTPAHQDPNKEECWTFTDNDGDHKFLVRTDFVDLKNWNYLEHLYVLLEFTIGLRTQGTHEPGSKGRHRAVSFHSDSLSIDEEKKKSSESESSDSDNDKQEATIKASRKKDRPANSRGKAAENRNSNEKADECQVEMSCGWCKVSMAQIVSMSQTGRIQLDIQGGTPFASESIKPNDIRARRYGWRAAVKKVAGVKKSSQMELKIIPVHKLAAGQKEDIYRMPKNILLPFSSINLVRLYREYAVVKIHDTNLNQSNPIAGLAYGTKFSEPVLALFPKMINDQAMQLALRHHWEEELKDLLPLQKTETNLMIEKFQAIVLRLWPAYSTVEGRKDSRVPESYESMQKRAMILMQAGKGAIPFHERSEIRDTSTADNKKADGKNDDIQGIVKGKQESSIGKVESNSSEEDEGLEEAYIPFHSAEVAFGVSSV